MPKPFAEHAVEDVLYAIMYSFTSRQVLVESRLAARALAAIRNKRVDDVDAGVALACRVVERIDNAIDNALDGQFDRIGDALALSRGLVGLLESMVRNEEPSGETP